jgi:tRNA(Ile2)-agmatinylcytidine synthase
MDSVLHIGIDDTDSTKQGCTTYIAALLVEKLEGMNAVFLDYPHLIRLNPNVPWKTRGNGALCLRVKIEEDARERLVDEAVQTIEENADRDAPGTEPGLVVYAGQEIPSALTAFARRTITRVVRRDEAMRLIQRLRCEAVGWKGGRGVIGALAAIGEPLLGDHTYELIAYRTPQNRGTARRVDDASVWDMDRKTRGLTFNNVDEAKRRILITPRGPDPVLLGIRGETAEAVKTAFKRITILEAVERWVVFRTNQGTDAHLSHIDRISQARPNRAVIVVGSVIQGPKTIPGRHVIFTLSDDSGRIDCAAYEPTGKFRNAVRQLIIGDVVEVYGGVRPPASGNPATINLEKMRVIKVATKTRVRNPVCPSCGKGMESMGRGQGLRCKKCGRRSRNAEKLVVPVPRALAEGLCLPPPRAHRHLTKPEVRYGREKRGEKPLPPPQVWGLGKCVTTLP